MADNKIPIAIKLQRQFLFCASGDINFEKLLQNQPLI